MMPEHMDDAGWSAQDWAAVDDTVRETVLSRARVRAVLPRGPEARGAYNVTVPTFGDDRERLSLATTTSLTPLRISCKIVVRAEQLGDRDLVGRLAQEAARRVAAAEDIVLAYGNHLRDTNTDDAPWRRTTRVEIDGQTPALSRTGFAGGASDVRGSDPVEAVQNGISALQSEGHFGPYAVLMLPGLWRESASLTRYGQVRNGRHVLANVLGEGDGIEPLPNPGLPADGPALRRGIVLSLGTTAFDLCQVEPPSLTMVGYDDGDLVLRVEERLVLRVMDAGAARDILTESGAA